MILGEGQVVLRPIALEDDEITFRWRNGARARFLKPSAKTVEAQRAWIAEHLKRCEFNWMIEYRHIPVGMIALHDIEPGRAVLGRLLIGEETGVAPVFFEAERLVCDFAFNGLRVKELWCAVMESFAALLRVRSYLGYRKVGRVWNSDCGKYLIELLLSKEDYRITCRPKLTLLMEAAR